MCFYNFKKSLDFSQGFFVWIETSVRVEIHISIIRISWKVMEIFGHFEAFQPQESPQLCLFFRKQKIMSASCCDLLVPSPIDSKFYLVGGFNPFEKY